MIQFNSLIHGGTSKWVRDNLAFIAGVGFTFLIWQPQWQFSDRFTISVASLIGIFTYFCAYALYLHNRLQKLQLSNKNLANGDGRGGANAGRSFQHSPLYWPHHPVL